MAIKWRYVDKFEGWHSYKYWVGRKKGCTLNIQGDDEKGYTFYVERTADDLRFNSMWTHFPNPIAPLIGKRIKPKQGGLEAMQKFVEDWVDKYVPKLQK